MPELAQYLEHTVLKPDTAIGDIARVCDEAARFGFAAVCIPPLFVRDARNILGERSKTRLATVVGFPMGYSSISSKSDEIKRAMDEGASDIDAVLNISAVKSALWNHVGRDLDALTLATQSRGGVLKLILECGLLSTDELVRVIGMARDAGLPWLKTGTGFHGHNATPNFRMTRAKAAKHTMVKTLLASIAGQKPRRDKSAGNARNMGRVGTTYQNVYQAWLAIFSCG